MDGFTQKECQAKLVGIRGYTTLMLMITYFDLDQLVALFYSHSFSDENSLYQTRPFITGRGRPHLIPPQFVCHFIVWDSGAQCYLVLLASSQSPDSPGKLDTLLQEIIPQNQIVLITSFFNTPLPLFLCFAKVCFKSFKLFFLFDCF